MFHGRPFTLFIWQVPALLAPDATIRGLFLEAHELGAKALLALIGLHAGAAFFHSLVYATAYCNECCRRQSGLSASEIRSSRASSVVCPGHLRCRCLNRKRKHSCTACAWSDSAAKKAPAIRPAPRNHTIVRLCMSTWLT